MRPSTKRFKRQGTGRSHAYRGCLRNDAGAVVWMCEHVHDNRDNDSVSEAAARTCAEYALSNFDASAGDAAGILDLKTSDAADWLAARARGEIEHASTKAGGRGNYPESWVEVNGERFRAKLYEKPEDDVFRLYVAGPFGQDGFLESHVDLNTRRVHQPEAGQIIPLGWMTAARKFVESIPQWAPRSTAAQALRGGGKLDPEGLAPRDPQDAAGAISAPSVYRVRVVGTGLDRSYEVVDVTTNEVVAEHPRRVPAYRDAEERNEAVSKGKEPDEWWRRYAYPQDYLGLEPTNCGTCGDQIDPEQEGTWLVDVNDESSGFEFCDAECAQVFVDEAMEEGYIGKLEPVK